MNGCYREEALDSDITADYNRYLKSSAIVLTLSLNWTKTRNYLCTELGLDPLLRLPDSYCSYSDRWLSVANKVTLATPFFDSLTPLNNSNLIYS